MLVLTVARSAPSYRAFHAFRRACGFYSLISPLIFYKPIGETLLAPGATCRLGFVRCDAFEVLEGETALSLREKSLEPGAAKLLVGVLKHNPTLVDIDLTATDLETEAANDLAAILEFRRLSALQLQFNPDLSAECRAALKAAAERWQPEMRLSL